MKQFIAILALILAMLANMQAQVINGVVLSAKDSTAIPFASVFISNYAYGVAANSNGNFELQLSNRFLNDSLKVSAIGFNELSMPVAGLLSQATLVFYMQPATAKLTEVEITFVPAKERLLEAITKLKEQLPTQTYEYNMFFRQAHKENGKYVRLIEADVDIVDRINGAQRERLNVQQMRRSNIYEANGDVHGDHLIDMFYENSATYPAGTVLDANAINYFELSYDTLSNTNAVVLKYNYSNPQSRKNYSGKIWINLFTNEIQSISEATTHNPNYRGEGFGRAVRWEFVSGEKLITFKRIGGRVYLDSLLYRYKHNIVDLETGWLENQVVEEFSCYVLKVDVTNRVATTGSRGSDLYMHRHNYDQEFWVNYNGLQAHPLPLAIQRDLEKWVLLNEQFKNNGRNGSGS